MNYKYFSITERELLLIHLMQGANFSIRVNRVDQKFTCLIVANNQSRFDRKTRSGKITNHERIFALIYNFL